MTIAVDLGRKARKQTNKQTNSCRGSYTQYDKYGLRLSPDIVTESPVSKPLKYHYTHLPAREIVHSVGPSEDRHV